MKFLAMAESFQKRYLAHKENPSLQFVYPKEGAIFWMDNYAIPTTAKNVEGAHKFIDFLLRPENAKVVVTAAAMVKDLGYVVKVYAENKTDFDARLSVSEAVVNDVTLRPEFLEDIPAKRAGYYTLYFGVDVLRVLNIEQINSVILKTTMYNAKDINAAPLVQTDFNLKVK